MKLVTMTVTNRIGVTDPHVIEKKYPEGYARGEGLRNWLESFRQSGYRIIERNGDDILLKRGFSRIYSPAVATISIVEADDTD